MKTLIVVDVQNDFCTGSLAVPGGTAVAEEVCDILGAYDLIVATQDWHVDPGPHFSENPDYVDSWPRHCEASTSGAALEPTFRLALDTQPQYALFRKGEWEAAYSGFEAHRAYGKEMLADFLTRSGVTQFDVAGIATDHCVKATVLDGLSLGYDVRVLADLTAAVGDKEAALDEMRAAGAVIFPEAVLVTPEEQVLLEKLTPHLNLSVDKV